MSDETDRLLKALNHQIAENEMLTEAWQSAEAENQRLLELLRRWVQHDEDSVIGDFEHLSLLEATGEVLDAESEVGGE